MIRWGSVFFEVICGACLFAFVLIADLSGAWAENDQAIPQAAQDAPISGCIPIPVEEARPVR